MPPLVEAALQDVPAALYVLCGTALVGTTLLHLLTVLYLGVH